jgi:hypothetical protein
MVRADRGACPQELLGEALGGSLAGWRVHRADDPQGIVLGSLFAFGLVHGAVINR